jgi:carboxylesterase type B
VPVLFYIHGGGMLGSLLSRTTPINSPCPTDFIYGNPVNWPFDSWVSQSPNVVIVSVYYRLSSFGFLSHPSVSADDLNAGFRDQIEALRWVQKHISAFGGDPTKVTINGHSAGGASVELHLVTSENQERLFRGAIAQSVSRRPLPLPAQQQVRESFFFTFVMADYPPPLASI